MKWIYQYTIEFTSLREAVIYHLHVFIIGRALHMSISPKYLAVSCFNNKVMHIRFFIFYYTD